MFKASISVRSSILSRLRITHKIGRFYVTRSNPISCKNYDEEKKVDRLLVDWPGKYRFDINVVMREISEDEALAAEAKQR
jgi:hypothetical protein